MTNLRYGAILFDHDGVLADSEGAHMRAWRIMLEEKGIPFDERDFRHLIGHTGPDILTGLLAKYRPDLSLPQNEVIEWVDYKNEIYRAGIAQGIRLTSYPGVVDGITEWKKRGGKVGVVSNARRSELLAGLQATGIFPLCDAIFSRDDVPQPKPHPSAFLTACIELGVEPSHAVAIDDSPVGLQSALLARIPAVSVLTTHELSSLKQPVPGRPDLRPLEIFETMADFFAWVLS